MQSIAVIAFLCFVAPFALALNPSGDLRVEVITAYNLIVDSNVESPSSYAPRSAYLGAKFYNDGTNTMTNVFAYIGNYIDGTNDTPGTYPSRIHSPLIGPLTGGAFALTHEGGSAGTADATRYLGSIPPGGHVTVYWLISYPNKDTLGKAVWGPSVKPDDDLWLEYDIWGRASYSTTNVIASVTRKVTMRNEISSQANKIFPNNANKVPSQYLDMMNQYVPSWTNLYSDGTPGTRVWTEGIWYDLGNVSGGFDNDGDMVPDNNAWLQPVGDPTLFDSASFRLLKTSAMIVVKLKSGGEQVYIVEDQLYFSNIPENNGVVGLVRYEFLPIKSGGLSTLSPYQEAASGNDTEKFNGDYGATMGSPISSGTSKVDMAKSASTNSAQPGDPIQYAISFTNSGTIAVGDPTLNMPLVVRDSIPSGTVYTAGSAYAGNTLPTGVVSYQIMYSTNYGTNWSFGEPSPATNITDIQWWLSDKFQPGATGVVRFAVTVKTPYLRSNPQILNIGGLSFGSTDPFLKSNATTMVTGTNQVGDMVFVDNGAGGGVFGDGIRTGSETGISNVPVRLYYDANSNGVQDASDILIATTYSNTNGYYLFPNVADGVYVVAVDTLSTNIPYGYTTTTNSAYGVSLDPTHALSTAVIVTNADFGFAPALMLDKSGTNTVREGRYVTYQIVATNRLQGDGGIFVWNVWATNTMPGTPYTKGTVWTYPTNAYIPGYPDSAYASCAPGGNADAFGMNGYYIAPKSVGISKVEVIMPMKMEGVFTLFDDTFGIDVYTNADGSADFGLTNLFYTFPSGDYVWDITSRKTWTWNDFRSTNSMVLSVTAAKVGAKDGGTAFVDQVGFRITADQAPSPESNPSGTLNPVPLVDQWNANFLDFVSSTPSPDSVTTNGSKVGTLTWNNIGPIFAGGQSTVAVTFIAIDPPNNATSTVTNIAYISSATYANGRPANVYTDSVVTTELPAGMIGDFIWRDLDSDGVQDGGNEKGIANVSVSLTPPAGVDIGNGAGVPVTNVTDASGYYRFLGLPADGTYTVAIVSNTLPGGSGTCTFDRDGTNNGVTPVFIDYDSTTGGDTVINADFGYVVSTIIDGTVWHDLNRNGASAPDTGEEWLTNVTVYLFTGSTPGTPATAIATNYTTTSGYFKFTGNFNGTYNVQIYTNNAPFTGSTWTESFDTDGLATMNYAILSIVLGGYAREDFSCYRNGAYDIGDTLFYDWNGNKIQDANEEGVQNITVYLYEDANGNSMVDADTDALIGSRNTSLSGSYLFQGYPASNYLVAVAVQDPDLPTLYTITADPYGVNDGRSLVTITSSNMLNQDFGFKPYGTCRIGDTIWYDFNGDGLQSGPLETGLVAISVSLLMDRNGDGVYVTNAVAQTDASGYYMFTNVADGNYRVDINIDDPDIPRDIFSNRFVLTTPYYFTVAVSNGNSYITADFGLAGLGAIGDTVFWDSNQSGTQDPFENGITGVTVNLYIDVNGNKLYDGGDAFYGSKITSTNGLYLFTGLATGRYVVVVSHTGPITNAALMADPDADGIPASATNGVAADGQTGVRIGFSSSFMGADFGYVPPGVIGDTLWIDVNTNGVRDANEVGIPYVNVELYTNDVLVATNVTDSDGYYMFSNIGDATYTVKVLTTDPDFPAELTAFYDPDGTLDSQVTNIVVSSGHITSIAGVAKTNFDLCVDFGYKFAGTNRLGGTIGMDGAPTNGIMGVSTSGVSADESAFVNVEVYLYFWDDNGNNVIDSGEVRQFSSTLTDTNGDYLFTDLPVSDGNDRYIVSISAPDSYLRLTTTNGCTPAYSVSNTVDSLTNTVSAVQFVNIAAVITNMDFAFISTLAYDFGDLPQSYSTKMSDVPRGPQHKVKASPDLYLGNTVDTESDGKPSAEADGDGADEDGVDPLFVWPNSGTGQVQVTVGKGAGWLVGYIDFNNDGTMTDYGEMVISRAVSTNGSKVTTNYFAVPTNTMAPSTETALYARFRLLPSQPAFPQFAYSGRDDNGEVEDYKWYFGSIGDYVWKDVNGDGVQDAGEPAISGVRVFLDMNGDGQFQANEPYAITAGSGIYGIGGICTGSYTVAVDTNSLPAWLFPSYDADGEGTPNKVSSVEMTNRQVRTNIDFGYQPLALGGVIWLDSDTNGLRNESGAWISNKAVRLYDSATNLLATTNTGTNGAYMFEISVPGTYYVEFVPGTYKVSPKDVGDDSMDSDADTNSPYRTVAIVVAPADRQMHWDMGLYMSSETNILGDRVWFDKNRDGNQEWDEAGYGNVTVELYDSSSNLVSTTLTDINGNYNFSGITPAGYYLRFVKPADYFFSPKDAFDDSGDSDADTNTGWTALLTIGSGEVITKWDAGLFGFLDLVVTKTVNDAAPNPSNTIWYTVTVSNKGPSRATGLQLQETWPTNVTYTNSWTSLGSYNPANKIWTVGTLSSGAWATLTITGVVNYGTAGLSITNSAGIISLNEYETNSLNNTGSVEIVVNSLDIGVYKTVNNSTPYENSNIVYTISATNYGPKNGTNVQITDVLPAGLTYVSYTSTTGSYNSGSGVWTIPVLNSGSWGSLSITSTVNAGMGGKVITNNAALTFVTQPDTNSLNNSSTSILTVVGADLRIIKSVNNPSPSEGATIVYSIALTNYGPNTATNVLVTEPLTNGITYVSYTASTGSYNSGSGLWTVGTVSNGYGGILQITVSVNNGTAGQVITNVASITSSSLPDPVSGNNKSTNQVNVSNLKIFKSSDTGGNPVYAGSNIAYTLIITNAGLTTHTGVSVTDALPATVTYVGGTAQMTYPLDTNENVRDEFNTAAYSGNNGTISWAANWVETGEATDPAAGYIRVLAEGTQTNVVRFTKPGLELSRQVNIGQYRTAQMTFNYRRAGLTTLGDYVSVSVSNSGASAWVEVARIAGPDNDAVYQNASYDISPYISTNTAIRFLSAGMNSAGQYIYIDNVNIALTKRLYRTDPANPPPVFTTGRNLIPGEYIRILYTANVTNPPTALSITNRAGIMSDSLVAPVTTQTVEQVRRADLAVTKNVNTNHVGTNETVWFTIAVTNNGPHVANNVEVTEYWPNMMVFSNAWVSTGTYSQVSGVWTVGTLNVSEGGVLVITGSVDNIIEKTQITNRVQVTNLKEYDWSTNNNSANIWIETLVVLAGFDAMVVNGKVVVEWETASETKTMGYHLYRKDYDTGEFVRISPQLLPVLPGRDFGGVYRFIDKGAKEGVRTVYRLDEVEITGRLRSYGPFTIVPAKARREGVKLPEQIFSTEDRRFPAKEARLKARAEDKVRLAQEKNTARKKLESGGDDQTVWRAVLRAWKRPELPGQVLTAEIAVKINSKGKVTGVRIVNGSGNKVFDDSLLKAAKSLQNIEGIDVSAVKGEKEFTVRFEAGK